MSVDRYAALIAGFKFPIEKFKRTVQVRGCNHPNQADKFCSKCGKPTYREYRDTPEWVEGQDHDDLPPFASATFKSIEVIETGEKVIFFGKLIGHINTMYGEAIDITDVMDKMIDDDESIEAHEEALITDVKELLEMHGFDTSEIKLENAGLFLTTLYS